MKLKAQLSFFKRALKGTEWSDGMDRAVRYSSDTAVVSLDTADLSDEQIELISDSAKKGGDDTTIALARKIEAFAKISADPEGQPVGRLERLEVALTAYLKKADHKFIWHEEADGMLVPYLVTRIYYEPADSSRGKPAHCFLKAIAIRHGDHESLSVSWDAADLGGKKTAPELLADEGCYRETPELYEQFEQHLKRHHEIAPLCGHQFSAIGFSIGARYDGRTAMVRDGVPSRVVIDNNPDEDDDERTGKKYGNDSASVDGEFWSKKSNEDDETAMAIPIQAYVQIFDLGRHQHSLVHVSNLTEYKYDDTLAEKLVLPDGVKFLVESLIMSAAKVMEDIIAGKTGGVVIIATGEPGTGKTLTAEVYSEQIRRPLYMVQCSQLGTDEEELEKKLDIVLTRASRWGAILLIDEADVYVRERGMDLRQNAIVGVFLRLLERYRGVLFLTSNRVTEIDDAILSRAIAHVRYALPDKAALARLWRVLGDNYKANLSAELITSLVDTFPLISGRNVKTMLKLASIVSAGKPATVETFKTAAHYIDFPKPANDKP